MTTSPLGKRLTLLFAALAQLGSDSGPPSATVALLRLMRHIDPSIVDVAVLQAHELFGQRRFGSARQVLEEAEVHAPRHPVIKAMLAAALFGQGDPLWEAYANEARQLAPDDEAETVLTAVESAAARASGRHAADRSAAADEGPAEMIAAPLMFGLRC